MIGAAHIKYIDGKYDLLVPYSLLIECDKLSV